MTIHSIHFGAPRYPSTQGFVHWTHMEVAAGAEATAQALDLLEPATGAWAVSEAMWELVGCLLLTGRVGDASARMAELDAAATRTGNPIALYAVSLYRALLAAAEGDLGAAESWADTTVAFCERAGLPWGSVAHGYLGWLALWRGTWDDARTNFEEAARREPPGFFRGADPAGLAMCLAYCGERAQVLALLAQLEQDGKLPRPGVRNPLAAWPALLSAIEGLVVLGEREKAGALYPLVVEGLATGAVIDLWAGRSLERVAGLAAAAGGRWDDAQQHYERALQQADHIPHGVERAEVRRCYAAMLLERAGPGDQEQGRRLAQEAILQYVAVGMTGRVVLTQQLVLSGGTSDAVATHADGWGADRRPTFRREGEVWAIGYGEQVVRVRDARASNSWAGCCGSRAASSTSSTWGARVLTSPQGRSATMGWPWASGTQAPSSTPGPRPPTVDAWRSSTKRSTKPSRSTILSERHAPRPSWRRSKPS